MGQFDRGHVFVCTAGDACATQGDVEQFTRYLRGEATGIKNDVRINKAGRFSQCGHWPMTIVYPDNVWYAGVQETDLQEIFESHILAGRPVPA